MTAALFCHYKATINPWNVAIIFNFLMHKCMLWWFLTASKINSREGKKFPRGKGTESFGWPSNSVPRELEVTKRERCRILGFLKRLLWNLTHPSAPRRDVDRHDLMRPSDSTQWRRSVLPDPNPSWQIRASSGLSAHRWKRGCHILGWKILSNAYLGQCFPTYSYVTTWKVCIFVLGRRGLVHTYFFQI